MKSYTSIWTTSIVSIQIINIFLIWPKCWKPQYAYWFCAHCPYCFGFIMMQNWIKQYLLQAFQYFSNNLSTWIVWLTSKYQVSVRKQQYIHVIQSSQMLKLNFFQLTTLRIPNSFRRSSINHKNKHAKKKKNIIGFNK